MALLPSIPSFDDPIELLYACHGNVRRFALALERLSRLPPEERVGASARQTARQILNYFDRAAVNHHEDEEADLFPALRRLGDPDLNREIDRLEHEHKEMSAAWQAIRRELLEITEGQSASLANASAFADLYRTHAAFEDDVIYPVATTVLDPAALLRLGHSMAARRGAPAPTRALPEGE